MNSYEYKLAQRKARLEARSERLQRESAATLNSAHDMASVIPFGQPIIVGHHSEGRDRRYRSRIHDKFSKGFALADQARATAARAASVGTGGISSDDPDAVSKLREELAPLEAMQQCMRDANAAIRKHAKTGEAAQISALAELGFNEARARKLLQPDFCGRIGFPDYALTNNSANIRRIKARIEALAAAPKDDKETTIGAVTIRQDATENRVMLLFPSKPPEATLRLLKSWGFRWSPTNGAWQRQLNNAGIAAAQAIAAKLAEVTA